MDFALRLLVEAGVAVTPGVDFDVTRGAGHDRFSFAVTNEDMIEAMDRIARWVR